MKRYAGAPGTVTAVRDTFEEMVRVAREAGLRLPLTVRFGAGAAQELGNVLPQIAESEAGAVMVVGGWAVRDAVWRARWTRWFGGAVELVGVEGEPDCEMINRWAAEARRWVPRVVVGMGGGSAMDTAKALAAMARNEGPVEDYLEGAEPRRPIEHTPVPVVAIPTTAGTGSEMTRNAVIGWPARRVKRSLRDDRLMPAAAIMDPELTLDLPSAPTLWSGLDALTQLVEACISRRATAVTTTVALQVIGWIRWALPVCLERPRDVVARAAMAAAASLSGVCLANAGLAMAHGIAAALGAVRAIPHGLACGILLPHTLRCNREAAAPALGRVLAAWLGEPEPTANTIERGLDDLDVWYQRLGVPADLRGLQLTPSEVDEIAAGSLGRSMDGNPVPMSVETVRAFLRTVV